MFLVSSCEGPPISDAGPHVGEGEGEREGDGEEGEGEGLPLDVCQEDTGACPYLELSRQADVDVVATATWPSLTSLSIFGRSIVSLEPLRNAGVQAETLVVSALNAETTAGLEGVQGVVELTAQANTSALQELRGPDPADSLVAMSAEGIPRVVIPHAPQLEEAQLDDACEVDIGESAPPSLCNQLAASTQERGAVVTIPRPSCPAGSAIFRTACFE